jgi:hypothetical protein
MLSSSEPTEIFQYWRKQLGLKMNVLGIVSQLFHFDACI